MPLSDKELRDVLLRADEIHRATLSGRARDAELQTLLSAAEDAGYNRAAVELALREKLELPTAPPRLGELVFARSADGKYYPATVVWYSPEATRVRFLRGSEHLVASDQLRPGAILPGDSLWIQWPMWGAWRCTVVEYDPKKESVKLSDRWGSDRWFPLAETWLEKPSSTETAGQTVTSAVLTAVSAMGGAAIGSLITYLLLR